MPRLNPDFLFALFETQRMLRLYADKLASRYGITRAQWAVLAKLERTEGLKQSELAELMEMQPITLTRLIDRLCEAGLIERRADPHDRRVNRLYLLPAARPLLAKLAELRGEITEAALGPSAAPAPTAWSPSCRPSRTTCATRCRDVATNPQEGPNYG